MIPRLYLAGDLTADTTVAGTDAQAHYLRAVLRRAAGDKVQLFNGRHGEFDAHITTLGKHAVTFAVAAQRRPQAGEPDLWLAFGLLKRDATDLVVQKATELGASAILPILSERTNATGVRLDRLHAIAVEAAEQCERLTIPVLHTPQTLAALLGAWPADRPLAAALERTAAPPPRGQSALLIGPEGGFSPKELDLMRAAPFIQPVSFGPRILRAETAAIAGLALLLAPV
jgi:16S rRNA (uracil1498-N3)-methyltransferase